MSLDLAREVLIAAMGLKGNPAAADARYLDALERATEYRETALAVVDLLAKYGISSTMLAAAARGVEQDDALADLFCLVEAFHAGDDINGLMVAGLEVAGIPVCPPDDASDA